MFKMARSMYTMTMIQVASMRSEESSLGPTTNRKIVGCWCVVDIGDLWAKKGRRAPPSQKRAAVSSADHKSMVAATNPNVGLAC